MVNPYEQTVNCNIPEVFCPPVPGWIYLIENTFPAFPLPLFRLSPRLIGRTILRTLLLLCLVADPALAGYQEIFKRSFHSPGYRPFKCHQNIYALLKTFREQNLDLAPLTVCLITHQDHDQLKPVDLKQALDHLDHPAYLNRSTLRLYQARDTDNQISTKILYHVVLILKGLVLDPDYTANPRIDPLATYIRQMLIPPGTAFAKRPEAIGKLVVFQIPASIYFKHYQRRSSYALLDLKSQTAPEPLARLISPKDWLDDLYQEGSAHYNEGTFPLAAPLVHHAARKGHLKAQYLAGLMFATGRGYEKNLAQAVRWLEKAAAGEHAAALNGLAWIYATTKEPSLHSPEKGLAMAQKAVKALPGRWFCQSTLAAALAANGHFDMAVNAQELALTLLLKTPDLHPDSRDRYHERGEQRLNLYRQHRIYRE